VLLPEAGYVPSVAVTVWVPVLTAGTVSAQLLKLPLASAVQVRVLGGLQSRVTVMGAYGRKPVPLTAMLLPTATVAGVTPMDGAIVKVVLPEYVPEYVPSDTVTM
jgi:hypothetical protein